LGSRACGPDFPTACGSRPRGPLDGGCATVRPPAKPRTARRRPGRGSVRPLRRPRRSFPHDRESYIPGVFEGLASQLSLTPASPMARSGKWSTGTNRLMDRRDPKVTVRRRRLQCLLPRLRGGQHARAQGAARPDRA
jgi:hypothetical protein